MNIVLSVTRDIFHASALSLESKYRCSMRFEVEFIFGRAEYSLNLGLRRNSGRGMSFRSRHYRLASPVAAREREIRAPIGVTDSVGSPLGV